MTAARPVYRSDLSDSSRWDAFEPRAGDIIITTPAKSGTTWSQMLCALLVFQTPELPASLSRLSPWLDILVQPIDEVLAELAAQRHRRFIKTHTPLDGLPWDDRNTYMRMARDPRDAALSRTNHRSNARQEVARRLRDEVTGVPLPPRPAAPRPSTPIEHFWDFVDDESPPTRSGSTLRKHLHHLTTVWARRDEPNIVLLHYADVRADLDCELRRLSARLGIPVDEHRWPSLVRAAGFESMRDCADRLAPEADRGFWHDNRQFFASGAVGAWRDLLTPDDLARYDTRVASLAHADLLTWLHRERGGVSAPGLVPPAE